VLEVVSFYEENECSPGKQRENISIKQARGLTFSILLGTTRVDTRYTRAKN